MPGRISPQPGPLRNVVIVGCGHLGSAILDQLLASLFNVTVVTRSATTHKFAQPVRVREADYNSFDSLKTVFLEQDVVISTVGLGGLAAQKLMIVAAIDAGVKLFIPSDFSFSSGNQLSQKLPIFGPKVSVVSYLEEKCRKGNMKYTIVKNGAFLETVLTYGLLIDFANRSMPMYDGGERPFSISRMSTIGRAVVGILRRPEETANRAVFIHDMTTTQNTLLSMALRADTNAKWEVRKLDTDVLLGEAFEAVWRNPKIRTETTFKFLAKSIVGEGYGGAYEEVDNELLGIRGMNEQELEGLTISNHVKVASSALAYISKFLPFSQPTTPPPQPTNKYQQLLSAAQNAFHDIQKQLPTKLPFLPSPTPTPTSAPPTGLSAYLALLHSLPTPEFTPTLLTAALLLLTFFTTAYLAQMSWSSRFGSWSGRFSPFGSRGDSSTTNTSSSQVNDADFSYITADDLKQQAREDDAREREEEKERERNPRDTDVLVFKEKRVSYPVHFPAWSIDKGELRVGEIRGQAARKILGPQGDRRRVRMFWKGRQLKDDERTARQEGLRSAGNAEILCVVGDAPPPVEDESEDEEEEDSVADGADGDKPKRKRNRNKKKKGGKKKGSTATPPIEESDAERRPPPPVQKLPLTDAEKLDAIASSFHTTLVPECIRFTSNPPADAKQRKFDHARLTETIMTQVMLKLDAVESDDPAVKQRRRELVREVQQMWKTLDTVIEGDRS